MQRIPRVIKKERLFLLTSFIYVVSAFLIFPYLGYYVDNPDTISYINIARKYAQADFSNAVNGYWSPLISWILALMLKFGGDDIMTFKYLQLIIGWFVLFNFTKLLQSFIHSPALKIILSLSCVPFALSYSLLNLSPDFLFLSIVLFYLNYTSEKEFFNHRHFGLIAGVLGVLMYFSKSFGFLFFLIHFSIVLMRNIVQTKEYAFKRHLWKNYMQSMLYFLCISAIWIYLISDKYGHFTISENVSFNLSRNVAAAPEEINRLPVLSGGLYLPPINNAVNAWEDPGLAVAVNTLHPFSSRADFITYRQVLKRNFLSVYYFDFRRQTGTFFFILLIAFLIFGKQKKFFTDDYFFSLFLTIILVYAGYSMILVHLRYVWICSLLMLLVSVWFIEELPTGNKNLQFPVKFVLVILVVLIAIKRPIKEILYSSDKDVDIPALIISLSDPFKAIRQTYEYDAKLNAARAGVKGKINAGSRIASLINTTGERDGYTQASLMALYSNAYYLGQVSGSEPTLPQQLKKFNVDYLISFSRNTSLSDTLQGQLIYTNGDLPVEVYSLKKING